MRQCIRGVQNVVLFFAFVFLSLLHYIPSVSRHVARENVPRLPFFVKFLVCAFI